MVKNFIILRSTLFTVAVVLSWLLLALHPAYSGNGLEVDVHESSYQVYNPGQIIGAAASPIVLYDGSLGTTPDKQGFSYQTLPDPPVAATQTFSSGVTILDTNLVNQDLAGYYVDPAWVPGLDRTNGYRLDFAIQVITETHAGSDRDGDGIGDRAGFSLTVLSSDLQGIELGFWTDEIWAQADGEAVPPDGSLFTHAEGVSFDTTAAVIPYHLQISGDTYTLSASGTAILTGPLRDYSSFDGFPNPYRTPDFIFLGDNTASARAAVRLAFVSITVNSGASELIYLPLVQKP